MSTMSCASRGVFIALFLVMCAGCSALHETQAPLFDGLGSYRRDVSTSDALAKRYFDQGLLFAYGFNHDEAVRSFRAATDADPGFAMAYWGIAWALGPNINAPMTDPAVAREAYAMAQEAKARSARATPVERALIEAVCARYADPDAASPPDRATLDKDFADAMASVWERYPSDPDVGSIYADALMNLSPWNQWTKEGEPQPNTKVIVATLEAVMDLGPHPMANHLYIHATEQSKDPGLAEEAADQLGLIAPGLGHLVHMPSHTYVRIGRYRDAAKVNQDAVEVDRTYFDVVGAQKMYEIYHAHNHHMRAYGAMFYGNQAEALLAGEEIVKYLPREALEQMPAYLEGFMSVPWHAMIRFGQWERILAAPEPDAPTTLSTALWHYARGIAFANTERCDRARAELAAFEQAAAQTPDGMVVGMTPAPEVFKVARHMLTGEILYNEGLTEKAFAELRLAVEAEDALPYDEPKGWMQPVRHALGALLLEQGRIEDAEAVYRADLAIHPENGWSLHGLAECLKRRGAAAESAEVQKRFARAWRDADITLTSSCFCSAAPSS